MMQENIKYPQSAQAFDEAAKFLVGGVNSPVRAFGGLGLHPLFIASAKGSKIHDIDGNEYIDYVGSWGPMIVGHAHPQVVEALQSAVGHGTSFGAPTRLEIELAELIVDAVPSIKKVRMVNSGTEATMSALRLARGFTGRDKIIKFTGCYHGHGDSLLVKAGSGVETLGMPDSPGVPADLAKHTVSLPFNNLQTVTDTCKKIGDQVAAIIVEPIAGNMGVLIPQSEFLPGLREVCNRHGIVLIFDEVMTGFRVSLGGAQELYGVMPDLTCLGKVIGGGLPVGAYGGKNSIMSQVAPEGPVYQAGTLSGNPLAMTAGIETVKLLKAPGVYQQLDDMAKRLSDGIFNAAKTRSIPVTGNRVGSMVSLFFTEGPVFNYDTAKTADTGKFSSYFHQMLDQGIYLAPSQFEAGFISLAHTEHDVDHTIKAAETAFQSLM